MARRICAACAAAIVLLGTGCSSVYLKGTPFYTGRRDRPRGDAEKRVNLWPAAYYRDPHLSVLWPLMSFTDDHVAVRPFASVYKLDEEKHQVNVLAPLMQFDYDTDDYRVFPVFWGDDYFVTFPLVWWFDDTQGVFPVFWWDDGFTALPLVWYEKDEFCHFFPLWLYAQEGTDGHDLHVLWPIGRHRKNDEETGFDIWPLLGSYSGEDTHRRYALWPLLQDRREDDERTRVAAPLWFQYESDSEAWWCLLPAAFRWEDEVGDSLTITPLWSSGTNDGTNWSVLFPLYYASANEKEDEQTIITLLGGRRRSEGHTAWYALPLLSSYAWGEGEKEFWFLGPLGHARWDADDAQHHVFPFYYYDSAEKMLLTPLASCKREPDDKFTNIGIILAHYGERGERKTMNFLWPIFQTNWGGGGSSFDIFPLTSWKWWDSNSEAIRGEEKRKHHIRHYGRSFWMFPWINTSQTSWVVTPDGADKPSERIETGRSGAFPLWRYRRTVSQGAVRGRLRVKAKGDGKTVTPSDQVHTRTDFSLLLWLYDYRRRSVEAEGAEPDERVRSRILWKLMHYERTDGDAALDIFPAITWDSKADGGRQFSFLWRFFRWGRPAQGGANLDLLFIPILRAKEKPEPEGT